MYYKYFTMHLFGIIIAILYITSNVESYNVDYDGSLNIRLLHALDNERSQVFTERGNISIISLRSGSATVSNNLLTPEEQNKLKNLAHHNELYRLKAITQNYDGTETELLTSVKACMLVESELKDVLTVSLDYMGSVIGVSQTVPHVHLCESSDMDLDNVIGFYSTVYVQQTENGPIPDTASYIQKIEREREARERGDVKDNRSFLAKYWMYIVPVVIFMLISSAANPEVAAGAGGGVAARS